MPIASVIKPRANLSLIPAAHLLIVLKDAGATMMASGGGRTSGSPGFLYSLWTGMGSQDHQCHRIDEDAGRESQNAADVPAVGLNQLDEDSDVPAGLAAHVTTYSTPGIVLASLIA